MNPQYFWLILFCIVAYVVITDKNVAQAYDYVLKILNNKIRHNWWWMTNNPANPLVKYIMYRKNLKLSKELRAKIDKYYEENT